MAINDTALLILRLGMGLTFAAHGAQKAFGWWGGPGPEGWGAAIERMGFRPVGLFAFASVAAELVGGLLLAAGLVTPLAGALLVAQSLVIIGQAHWEKGFFSRDGGYEFPLALGVGAASLTLMGAGAISLDAIAGVAVDPAVRVSLLLLGLVAGGLALVVPRVLAERASRYGRPGAGA